jgi:hypothetical protein
LRSYRQLGKLNELPDVRQLTAGVRRVVKPRILVVIVNYFAPAVGALGCIEATITAACIMLGWRSDVLRPFGLFRLVELLN